MLLTLDRLNLNKASVNAINDLIFYRVAEANKKDELYNEIRVAIVDGQVKYKGIILSKYSVNKNVLYYLDRL